MSDDFTPDKAVSLPYPNKLLVVEAIDYQNPYDFKKPHRHDYFEVILVENGEGYQQIDFKPYTMQAGELYNVYPGQVHLMQRQTAQGLIIQFSKDLFEYIRPIQHYHLYFSNPKFIPNPEVFEYLYGMARQMADLLSEENLSPFSIYKSYNYLEIILMTLSELQGEMITPGSHQMVSRFLSLLSQNIYTHRKTSEYCTMMNCTRERLNLACKNALGKSALELIHEELLLEIRRLFLLSDLSLKEIAFELNFDSQANFSAFIKAQTGLTPSGLQAAVLKNS